jgi:hypothetical protein
MDVLHIKISLLFFSVILNVACPPKTGLALRMTVNFQCHPERSEGSLGF